MLVRFILRDLLIVALTLALWWLLAESSAGEGATADLSGWIPGSTMGVFAFYTYLRDSYLATRIARGGALFLALLGVALEVPLLLTGILTKKVPKQVAV